MVTIINPSPVGNFRATCLNCGSLMAYDNSDIIKEMLNFPPVSTTAIYFTDAYICCPNCGDKVILYRLRN